MEKLLSPELLIEEAKKAREHARAEYSNFKVGAAVQASSGKIYHGCNIESSSYGLTMCAERVAIFNAISSGETEIKQIAIVTDTEKASSPCGACRQVLVDYALESNVYISNCTGDRNTTTAKALLPYYFSKVDLLTKI